MRERLPAGPRFQRRDPQLRQSMAGAYWLAVEVQPIHDEQGRHHQLHGDSGRHHNAPDVPPSTRLAIQYEVSRALAGARRVSPLPFPQVLQAPSVRTWAGTWASSGGDGRTAAVSLRPGTRRPSVLPAFLHASRSMSVPCKGIRLARACLGRRTARLGFRRGYATPISLARPGGAAGRLARRFRGSRSSCTALAGA
jgi:hypothetical protein